MTRRARLWPSRRWFIAQAWDPRPNTLDPANWSTNPPVFHSTTAFSSEMAFPNSIVDYSGQFIDYSGQGNFLNHSVLQPIHVEEPVISTTTESLHTSLAKSLPKPGDLVKMKLKEIVIKTRLRLFLASKNKRQERVWLTLNSMDDFPVQIKASGLSFVDFRRDIIRACNTEIANSATIIQAALDSQKYDITWTGSIDRVAGWKKADKIKIDTPLVFDAWMNAIRTTKKPEVALLIKMVNPNTSIQQGKKVDLLAKRAAQQAAIDKDRALSLKRKSTGDDDSEGGSPPPDGDLEPEDWDNINFHMKRIYDKYPIKSDYDPKIPVFVNAGETDKYILLTNKACQEWGIALAGIADGVDMDTPPRSLPYESLQANRRKKARVVPPVGGHAPGQAPGQMPSMMEIIALADALNARRGKGDIEAIPSSPGHSHDPDEDPPMADYLAFLGKKLVNTDAVLEILISNEMMSHKSFAGGLKRSDVCGLGLSMGAVTCLFDNVARYDRYLAAKKIRS
ncbi:uncharacterized protein PGTG_09500 [Puccinia graminis f. sp. tritici CRL 75-36-700-3]|uniref:Uncharacterized protein n=1 Tax=Puccinia graminis f. sp. tritici (strain CRL 75-36-700-3 / race SCCL) TaxID=418459 RepID=E3KHL2_PUCGT|nr:uncharacterized protein PGTG_09500 [Puccinia graminis f. sp. tritici CRL 75-36-700-3]EFP83787.1 hypothetical protein PGTG_09500 [Puccinia graminis f. sp. tritici CRL 75-36-700-3]